MTADFTQILMPHKKGAIIPSTTTKDTHHHDLQQIHISTRNSSASSSLTKCLFVTTFIFMVAVTVVTTGLLVKYGDKLERYEDKMQVYENRISALETDLQRFIKNLMADPDDEEVEYETHADQDFGYDDEEDEDDLLMEMVKTPKEFKDESDEEQEERFVRVGGDEEHYGKIELEQENTDTTTKSRRKRQIPYPNVPTFGPDVQRTGSGVPIVEESYLSSAGVTLRPRYSPTTSGDGLTLYTRLVERGGSSSSHSHRNLDSTHVQQQQHSSLLPHHQVSAAWSEQDQGSEPRSRIQLKSGDNSGSSTSSESGANIGTGGTRTRSESTRRSQHYTYHRGTTLPTTSSNSNIVMSGGSGATYHRNSRVPSTGDYFYPSSGSTTTATKTFGSSSDNTNARIQYPPLRKLTVGNGEGEVIARVLQTDRDNDSDNTFASANLGQSEASSSRRVYRGGRHHNTGAPLTQTNSGGITSHAQTQSYSGRGERRKYGSGRKVNNYRTRTTTTTAAPPASFSTNNNDNVNNEEHEHVVPFNKYYSRTSYDAQGTNSVPRRNNLAQNNNNRQIQSMESFLSQQQYYGALPVGEGGTTRQ